jgi:hypothetical protein
MIGFVTGESVALLTVLGFWGWVFCVLSIIVRVFSNGTCTYGSSRYFAFGFFLAFGLWLVGMARF